MLEQQQITLLLPQFDMWQVVNSREKSGKFTPSLLTISHMTSCNKCCVISCGPSIIGLYLYLEN